MSFQLFYLWSIILDVYGSVNLKVVATSILGPQCTRSVFSNEPTTETEETVCQLGLFNVRDGDLWDMGTYPNQCLG